MPQSISLYYTMLHIASPGEVTYSYFRRINSFFYITRGGLIILLALCFHRETGKTDPAATDSLIDESLLQCVVPLSVP